MASQEPIPVPHADTDSDHALEQLRQVTLQLLDARHPPYSLGPEVAALRDLLSARAPFQIDRAQDITDGETRFATGLAVSPTQAAMCADEVAGTPAFIRGLHAAIQQAVDASAGKRIHILYAGCGPYALLVIPQMAVFSPQQVSFTLLDCHELSLGSAKSIVDALGLSEYVIRYHAGDAAGYEIPADETPDVIVSETMNVGLSDEPLVMIARHLLGQAPSAALVPQSVRIDACLVDMSREFTFAAPDQAEAFPVADRDRVRLGTVFELSAEAIQQWASLTGDRLPAAHVQIPNRVEERYEAKLLTRINVYGDVLLQDYDCSLTIPQPFPVKVAIQGGETFGFHYRLGSYPKLICDEVA